MKLSQNTIALLKNFAAINSNICIPAGNVIKTMSVVGNALATATIEDEFLSDVLIYDLGELLSVLAIAPDGDITLSEKHLTIKWGTSKVRYAYADVEIMRDAITASTKNVKFPVPDVEFVLTNDMLASIHKASSILKAGFVAVYVEDGNVLIKVFDKSLINGNVFVVETGVQSDLVFEAVVDVANLKFLGGDYKVSLSKRNITRFEKVDDDVVYYVTADVSSKWE